LLLTQQGFDLFTFSLFFVHTHDPLFPARQAHPKKYGDTGKADSSQYFTKIAVIAILTLSPSSFSLYLELVETACCQRNIFGSIEIPGRASLSGSQ